MYCQSSELPGVHVDSTPGTSGEPGLIFGTGNPGSWDEAGVGHPVVRYYLGDNEQRWFMWYSGRSGQCHDIDDVFPSSGSIGLAVSSDGVIWSRGSGDIEGARGESRAADVGRILAPNQDWWWHDTCHMHISDVQILSNSNVTGGTGVYWAFYSGGSYEEVEAPEGLLLSSSEVESSRREVSDAIQKPNTTETGDEGTSTLNDSMMREGLRLRPGLAMSQDGRNFARIEADHYTGALFDVGEEGEWDSLFVGSPQVVASGPRDIRMYYHSYDASRDKYIVGLATSPDGFKWTKQGPIFEGGSQEHDFDGRGAASRCVVRDIDSKHYFMFYEAVAYDNRRSIGLAVSKDGIRGWQRYSKPVLAPSTAEGGGWDCASVGTPWAVSMAKGQWRLYYSGKKNIQGPWEGIGLALSDSDGSEDKWMGAPVRFKRRTGPAAAAAGAASP